MTSKIIRRRQGTNDVTLSHTENGKVARTVRLETNNDDVPMRERVARAIKAYLKTSLDDDPPLIATEGIEDREEQEQILRNAVPYFTTILQGLELDPFVATPRSRLVAAARTGKTVIMIKLVSRLGLRTVIIAPTGTIVEKTVEELQKKLPSVSVGAYHGPSKEIVSHGVTVATYQTLALHAKRGILPPSIKGAALVLCDEGHETMTENRQDALNAFSDQAIMIALTATPDYSRYRMLATYFPYLIDDVRLIDACARGQLAPTRVRVRAVQVDESAAMLRCEDGEVSIATVKGDFDGVMMARALKSATVFQACLKARYEESSDHPTLKLADGKSVQIIHKNEKAIICCPSVEFAHDLLAFMSDQRPAGASEPQIVVGDTPADERRKIIMALRAGSIDTVINVGVLLRGFDDPSLKLLIDLSPTISLVRAEQKFCRPCTKVGDRGAVIYLIYPHGLSPVPLLPTDIFGASYVGSTDQELTPRHSKGVKSVQSQPKNKKVSDLTRAVRVSRLTTVREFSIELKPPTFDPAARDEVRKVLCASADFTKFLELAQKATAYGTSDRYQQALESGSSDEATVVQNIKHMMMREARERFPSSTEFRHFLFVHDSFTGFGSTFLRFCKVLPGTIHFRNWLRSMLPELEIVLGTYEEALVQSGVINGVGEYVEVLVPNFDEFESDWIGPYERTLQREIYHYASNAGDHLSPRQQYVLECWLDGDANAEVSDSMHLSRERITQIQREGLATLRTLLTQRLYDRHRY